MTERMEEFQKLVEPVMEYLRREHRPHVTVVIDSNGAEMLEGMMHVKHPESNGMGYERQEEPFGARVTNEDVIDRIDKMEGKQVASKPDGFDISEPFCEKIKREQEQRWEESVEKLFNDKKDLFIEMALEIVPVIEAYPSSTKEIFEKVVEITKRGLEMVNDNMIDAKFIEHVFSFYACIFDESDNDMLEAYTSFNARLKNPFPNHVCEGGCGDISPFPALPWITGVICEDCEKKKEVPFAAFRWTNCKKLEK